MRKVIATEFMTLDGVVQSPSYPDEDPSGHPKYVASTTLIDELKLMIDPLVLGAGKRLFADGGPTGRMRLAESRTTSTGSLLVTYIARRKENRS